MLGMLFTYSLLGVDARPGPSRHLARAMPTTILVGLAEAVRKSTPRIERAIVNSGYARPIDRVSINLSPALLPQERHAGLRWLIAGVIIPHHESAGSRFRRRLESGAGCPPSETNSCSRC